MKKLLVTACAVLLALAGSAHAQGPVNWGGLYVGGFGGYGWGNRDGCFGFDPTCTDGTFDYDLEGGLAGGQIGYNHMFNKILLGVEFDGAFASLTSDDDLTIGGFPAKGEYTYFAKVGGRLGYAMNQFLIFGTGGLAIAGFDYENASGCTFDQTRDGYFVGGGAEFKITQRASLGVEYNYVDLGDVSQPCTSFAFIPTISEADATLDVFTFGFKYTFDGM